MEAQRKLDAIRRRTRRRLAFSLVVLVSYFGYVLNYLPSGAFLGRRLGESQVTGSLLMFAGLIAFFILLELVFLAFNRDSRAPGEG
ncbi:MAG: DUF485 domain-containing protein [Halieaceae bacterium]|nr:DUF485 domain-containing protein [Halieaceae bacterium]